MNRHRTAKKVEESAMKIKSLLLVSFMSVFFLGVSHSGVSIIQDREDVYTLESINPGPIFN